MTVPWQLQDELVRVNNAEFARAGRRASQLAELRLGTDRRIRPHQRLLAARRVLRRWLDPRRRGLHPSDDQAVQQTGGQVDLASDEELIASVRRVAEATA